MVFSTSILKSPLEILSMPAPAWSSTEATIVRVQRTPQTTGAIRTLAKPPHEVGSWSVFLGPAVIGVAPVVSSGVRPTACAVLMVISTSTVLGAYESESGENTVMNMIHI
jgi:hypothetical protein